MNLPESQRIAFISSLGFGGATTFLCNLAGELSRRQIPVIVVSPEIENPFASDFARSGVKVVGHDQHRSIFEDRMQAMMKTLADFRPTVVIACLGAASYEVLRYVPAGVHRMAVVQSDHPIFYDAISPYARFMDAAVGISSKITGRFAAMESLRDVSRLCLLHGVGVPTTVIPRGRTGQPLRILYLGRIMNPQKRVLLFPKILAGLQAAGIPFQWTIAGEGDSRAELERVMKSDNPRQQIVFTGAVPNAEVSALLEQQDVFLLASDSEGLPISLLEAMAHGLVPVVSDLESGMRDVVDNTNGLLVPVDEVAGYARAILHLHAHRDELAAKSAAAHERVKTAFSVAAMTDRWLAAFPSPPTSPVNWPRHWRILAPLTAPNKFYFSPPVRFLRRLAAKFR